MDPSKDTTKCPYLNNQSVNKQSCPHTKIPFCPIPPRIYNNVLETIGMTPMIRLNKIPQKYGVECEILVKCEYQNPGGSYKDRSAYRMVLDAEKSGKIKPGDTLIEASSGNMALGIALSAALKGYKCLITMPEKMSTEKVETLRALGAQIVRTPTEAASEDADSHINTAIRLQKEIPNAVILDQYTNPSNPLAHYDGTAEEIWYQTSGKLDGVVLGVGTGGGVSGLSRKLKEKDPNIQVIGVDPHGSILAQPQHLNNDPKSYKMEGIGYDFVPRTCDRSLVDKWYKCEDKTTLNMARELILEEGILCGGSSGAALYHALEYAKEHKLDASKRLVVILVDGIKNYMSKHLSKDWMVENLFLPLQTYDVPESKLNQFTLEDLRLQAISLQQPSLTVQEALDMFKTSNYIAIEKDGKMLALLTQKTLLKALMDKKLKKDDCVKTSWTKDFILFDQDISVHQLAKLLQRNDQVFIQYMQDSKVQKIVCATQKDILPLL